MPRCQPQHGVGKYVTVVSFRGLLHSNSQVGWDWGSFKEMKGQVYLLVFVSQSSAAGSPRDVTMGLLCRAALNGAERDSHQGLDTQRPSACHTHTPMCQSNSCMGWYG